MNEIEKPSVNKLIATIKGLKTLPRIHINDPVLLRDRIATLEAENARFRAYEDERRNNMLKVCAESLQMEEKFKAQKLETHEWGARWEITEKRLLTITAERNEARAKLATVRREALEEAAQVCDRMNSESPRKSYQDAAAWLAASIRGRVERTIQEKNPDAIS